MEPTSKKSGEFISYPTNRVVGPLMILETPKPSSNRYSSMPTALNPAGLFCGWRGYWKGCN